MGSGQPIVLRSLDPRVAGRVEAEDIGSWLGGCGLLTCEATQTTTIVDRFLDTRSGRLRQARLSVRLRDTNGGLWLQARVFPLSGSQLLGPAVVEQRLLGEPRPRLREVRRWLAEHFGLLLDGDLRVWLVVTRRREEVSLATALGTVRLARDLLEIRPAPARTSGQAPARTATQAATQAPGPAAMLAAMPQPAWLPLAVLACVPGPTAPPVEPSLAGQGLLRPTATAASAPAEDGAPAAGTAEATAPPGPSPGPSPGPAPAAKDRQPEPEGQPLAGVELRLYRENGDNGDNGDDGDDGAAARVAAVLARAFDLRPTPGCLQTEVAARLGLSGPATARAPHLLPQLGADLAGRAVLASALASLHAAEAGVRLGLDPEHVHKMRVATRRLRATLRLFSPCFPRSEADAAHRGLRWLSASLGRVRDLEVLLLGLEGIAGSLDCPPGGLDALRQLLSGRRSEARRRLAAALDSLRTQALGRRLKRLAAGPPPRRRGGHPAALPVALLARQALRRRWRQLRRAGRRALRSGLAEDVHCLRIAGKKMRYALEALRSLYPGGVDGLATRLVTLQDLLGRHQDQVTAATLLGELRDCLLRSPPDGEAARLPAATVLPFVLGQLHAAACLHAQVPVPGLRAAFRRACSERRGRELRRQVDSLARAMESTLRQPADPSSA